jgi:hypothetical protein
MSNNEHTGKSEAELIAKLEHWLAQQEGEPNIFDVLATGDGELFGGYVLQHFKAATREAALENIWVETGYDFTGEHRTARLVGAFAALAERWELSFDEKLHLLGLNDAADLDQLLALPLREIPIAIIERIATLFRIAQALRTLLPDSAAADGWVKRPNKAPMFAGGTALEFMLSNDLEGIRRVSAYLLAQIWST